jgi:hypothetical protein
MENIADVISKFSDSFYSIEMDFYKQTELLEKKYVREIKSLAKDLKMRVFTKDNIDAFRYQVLEDERHFDFYPTVNSVTDKKSISLLSQYLIIESEEDEGLEGSWINDYLPDEIILKQPQ